MSARWQYHRTRQQPDLDALGRAGWELAALCGDEWIFKRPEPGPAERFTLEQRAAALADAAGHRAGGAAPERRLLNPEVAALARRVNHTQMLLIADRGYPIPPLAHVVDLSLIADVPTVGQVLAAILPDLPADRLIVAEEQQTAAPEQWEQHRRGSLSVETVPHVEFKQLGCLAVGCIRTGDSTPYSNVLVVGG